MFTTLRKLLGLALFITAAVSITHWVEWNLPAVSDFVASVGGLWNVVMAVLGILALLFAAFPPRKWRVHEGFEWVRKMLIIVIVLAAALGGGQAIMNAFAQANWVSLLVLLGLIVLIIVLTSMTIMDKPLQPWRRLFKRRSRRQQSASDSEADPASEPVPATA